MKQLDILEKLVDEFKKDETILGVLLMGSVADGSASDMSDLDILILCDKDKFEAEFIDDVLVECLYMKYETALYKLNNKVLEVYHYINSKIIYGDKHLRELMAIAEGQYNSYKATIEEKKEIRHWLLNTRIKLQSAINRDESVVMNYITSTNSWKLIEAIWIVNNKPMPPSSSVIKFLLELKIVPEEKWFETLFSGSDLEKAQRMMFCINWVLPILTVSDH